MSKSFKIIASALLLAIGALAAGLVVLYKIDPKNRTRQRTALTAPGKATDKPSAPPAPAPPGQTKSRYQVSGSLPEDFGPAT